MCADRTPTHFRRLKGIIGPAAVLTVSMGVLTLFYWPVLSSLNQTFFGTYSDGLKNYFTPLYHTKHDQSLLHFAGLNYPYGDHIFYADAQPMLIWPIQLMENRWPGASGWTLGALNLAVLSSLLAGCLVLFLILKRLSLPDWYAAVVAPAIIFFSPQVWRMGGHYSLSYTVAIPLVWLLVIRFFEKPGWTRTLLLAGLVTFWTGFHVYYLALALTVVGLMWAFWLLTRRSDAPVSQLLPHLVVQVLLPTSSVYCFMRVTDRWLGDRAIPDEWGSYTSSLKAVFTPSYPPYLGSRFFDPLSQPEGIAYISVLGWVGLIFLVASIASRLFDGRLGRCATCGPWILRASIPAAFLALLIAFGFPFRIPVVEAVLPDQLRQFRVLGRFIWVFYYLFMAAAAYLVYAWYRMFRFRRARPARAALLALIAVFWLEVANFNRHVSHLISNRIEELAPVSDSCAGQAAFTHRYRTLPGHPAHSLLPPGIRALFRLHGDRTVLPEFHGYLAAHRTADHRVFSEPDLPVANAENARMAQGGGRRRKLRAGPA